MPPKEDYSLKETKPNIDGGIASASHKLTLVEQQQFVYANVVAANNLPVNELRTCDPYVELKVGNYVGRTESIPNKPNPRWDQVFAFRKDLLQGKNLEISVRDDKAVMSNEILGRISFVIADIPTRLAWDCPLAPQWYRLEDKNGLVGVANLMLGLWVGNQSDDAYSVAWHSDATAVSCENIAETRPKVYNSPRLWYLRVKVMEAQDLVPCDPNRKLEVFVKAALGTVVLRTKVSENKSVNPSWNEELMFVAAEPFEDNLILSIEDDLGDNRKDYLGGIVLPLAKMAKRLLIPPPSDEWLNLERHPMASVETKEMKFASKLHLTAFLDGVYHVFDEPVQFSSDFRATSPKLKPPEIGILEVGILKAEGLVPMKKVNGVETTDAYCVAKYGPKWTRTSTILGSSSPNWNEQFKWDVYDPYTVITLGVFDNCNLNSVGGGAMDTVIGKVRIRLSVLETDRIYSHAYPLLALKPDGLKKMGELHLTVRFICASAANLFYLYAQPLLPKAHYTNPLSVYQIESLRHQAVYLLCSRLGRADPPLRREVVEYMLDARGPAWSIRRAAANFARIMACLSCFGAAWKWFDDIRQWKNPETTIFTQVLFVIMICYPLLILPNFLLYVAVVSLLNYRKRPRQPPHMDPKLSQAEKLNLDEVDEELDIFPSTAPGEVVRRRYDRLRSFGVRMVVALGELATQLERFHSLLTWRDPRATFLFVIFCSIAASIFYYILSFRLFLCLYGLYSMRHPRLRVTLPPIPQNFIRRMPAREDSLF